MKQNSHDRAYMTPNEVAELLVVSPVTVRQWAQKGWIHAITTAGGHRRFLRSDVENFATEHGMELATRGVLRVLVVDDDRSFTSYLADLLSNHTTPFEVEVAYDGFEAGRKIVEFRPGIVLLDIRMPGMDGFSVCQQLKNDSHTKNIRIIAMTGYHTPENEEKAFNVGAEVCLSKPFDKKVLFAALLGLGLDIDESNEIKKNSDNQQAI